MPPCRHQLRVPRSTPERCCSLRGHGAILNARVGTVVYGASDPTFGACGGVMNLFEEAFGIHPRLYGGVLAEACTQVLQDFFRGLRED